MFDGEHGIALHAIEGNQSSSHGEWEVTCISRVVAGTCGTFSSYGREGHSKPVFEQRHQDSSIVTRNPSRIYITLGRAIRKLLEMRQEMQGTFLVAAVILGFLSILNKSQALSPVEALNSACLSMCQRDVRPPVPMSQGFRAFSRVSTGDSDIPSSCEMKEEPAFKHCREIQPSFESGHLGVPSN